MEISGASRWEDISYLTGLSWNAPGRFQRATRQNGWPTELLAGRTVGPQNGWPGAERLVAERLAGRKVGRAGTRRMRSADGAHQPGRQARIAEPGRGLPGEHVHLAGPEITDVHDDRLCWARRPRLPAGMCPRRSDRGRRRRGAEGASYRGGGQPGAGEARRT